MFSRFQRHIQSTLLSIWLLCPMFGSSFLFATRQTTLRKPFSLRLPEAYMKMTVTARLLSSKTTRQFPYVDACGEDTWSLPELQKRTEALLESNTRSSSPHKVCLAIAGGGGTALSTLAATVGASKLLLEGTITYDRSSYQTFVRKNSSSLSNITAESNDNPEEKFSYTSMEAARLASMSALWRAIELQSLNHGNVFSDGGRSLTHLIGVGAASTLQTSTAGAKSRTGRPSFGNIVATRGDGQQLYLNFTLNHKDCTTKTGWTTAGNQRFDQDVMVSHLIVSSLEHFLVGASGGHRLHQIVEGAVDPLEFPGVTVEEWSCNLLLESSKSGESGEVDQSVQDPVERSARRILSGDCQAVLLLPTVDFDDSKASENAFLQPIAYPILPEDCLIFPGSFNPPHHGHMALATAALSALQRKWDIANKDASSSRIPPIVFELSIANADKPSMDPKEVARRVSLFREVLWEKPSDDSVPSCWGILLTSAPLFSEKLEVLRQTAPSNKSSLSSPVQQSNAPPGRRWSFVIGTDTMVRILNPKYYNNDEQRMIQCLRNMDVDFVVGGRLEQSKEGGKPSTFVTGESELEGLNTDVQEMFLLLDESDFRVDISSTELRSKQDRTPASDDDDNNDDTGSSSGSTSSATKRRGSTRGSVGLGPLGKLLSVVAFAAISIPSIGLPICEATLATTPPPNVRGMLRDFPKELPNKGDLHFSRRLESVIPKESSSSEGEVCTPIEKCQLCSFNDQKNYEACKDTGRWEKFECLSNTENGASSRSEMRSCKHTEADEEFTMVQLQMMCFLIGSIAILSVRKQKRLTASLFDQRKQHGGVPENSASSKRDSNLVSGNVDEEIEFPPRTNQDREKVPLIEVREDDLEIV